MYRYTPFINQLHTITSISCTVLSSILGPLTLAFRTQSDTHVVLATLKRAPSELSSFSRKVFKIDDHLGIAASGLASDGRGLCRYMRNECINHRQGLPAPSCDAAQHPLVSNA